MAGLEKLKRIYHQWGGATTSFFTYTHLSHDLCIGLHMALLPLIKEDLGLNYLQAGLLLGAYQIAAGLSQIPGGWLGDRINRHIVLAIGLGGVGLAAQAVSLSTNYYSLLIILVVLGILAGAYHPSAASLLSGYVEEGRRGKVLGFHLVGGSAGFMLGPVIGGLLAGMMGWRFVFRVLSIPALVAVPLVLRKFIIQKRAGAASVNRVETSVAPAESAERLTLVQVLRPVAMVITMGVLSQLAFGSATGFIPLYLVDRHKIAPAYAAILLGVIRAGGVLGSLIGGWLSDRWGRKNAIFFTLIVIGPLLYILTRLPFNAVLMVVFVLFGIFMQMTQSTIQPFLMDNTPSQLRGIVFGLYFGLSMEGSSLLQPVTGYYMDIFGIINVFNFIALISVGLSLVTLLILKRPRLRR
ncbi:MAG: MFS transporter [Chloroflexi bacterium]|nr:MFS transporter [Chloroflexota bacterium]